MTVYENLDITKDSYEDDNHDLYEKTDNFTNNDTLEYSRTDNKEFIGDYAIKEPSPFKEGGLGKVYKCIDSRFDSAVSPVAIKVLKEGTSKEKITALKNEAIKQKELDHDNIVKIHGVYSFLEKKSPVKEKGCQSEKYCIVMDFIEGKTLEEKINENEKGLSKEDFLQYIENIASGLNCAHNGILSSKNSLERGLAHNDLKPGNILIKEYDNRAKISDFGGALKPDEIERAPYTIAYSYPDKIKDNLNRDIELFKKYDIWSLGIIFFEMLTGKSFYSLAFHCDKTKSQLKKNEYSKYAIETKKILYSGIDEKIDKAMELRRTDFSEEVFFKFKDLFLKIICCPLDDETYPDSQYVLEQIKDIKALDRSPGKIINIIRKNGKAPAISLITIIVFTAFLFLGQASLLYEIEDIPDIIKEKLSHPPEDLYKLSDAVLLAKANNSFKAGDIRKGRVFYKVLMEKNPEKKMEYKFSSVISEYNYYEDKDNKKSIIVLNNYLNNLNKKEIIPENSVYIGQVSRYLSLAFLREHSLTKNMLAINTYSIYEKLIKEKPMGKKFINNAKHNINRIFIENRLSYYSARAYVKCLPKNILQLCISFALTLLCLILLFLFLIKEKDAKDTD